MKLKSNQDIEIVYHEFPSHYMISANRPFFHFNKLNRGRAFGILLPSKPHPKGREADHFVFDIAID